MVEDERNDVAGDCVCMSSTGTLKREYMEEGEGRGEEKHKDGQYKKGIKKFRRRTFAFAFCTLALLF